MNDFTRRTFIGGAAAAPLLAQSASDTISVAFIGVGNRGGYLLKHTLTVPGVKVVAICDIDPARLAQAMAAARAAGQKPEGFTDFRKMLDTRKDIDTVVIATPVDLHKPPVLAALEVGKHVYSEKPVAHTAEDCRLIANAAKAAKGIYQSGFQLRHDPARNAAMRFVHSGKMGRVVFLQGYRHSSDLPHDTPWLFDRTRSGDAIVEQACHILDLMVWAIGKNPLRAMGSGGVTLYKDDPPGRTVTDNYSVIYDFPDDVRLSFSHIFFDPPGFSGIKERVFCAEGAIDLATAKWIARGQRGETELEIADKGKDSTWMSLAAFFDNARGRKMPLNNAESALRSTLVAMMGRKAIYEKRIVTWNEMTAG